MVDAETQTDEMDISETDLSPSGYYSSSTLHASFRQPPQPQRVIVQEIRNSESDEEGNNGNVVHLHYMAQHPQKGKS